MSAYPGGRWPVDYGLVFSLCPRVDIPRIVYSGHHPESPVINGIRPSSPHNDLGPQKISDSTNK